jgi:hypothetical protein
MSDYVFWPVSVPTPGWLERSRRGWRYELWLWLAGKGLVRPTATAVERELRRMYGR